MEERKKQLVQKQRDTLVIFKQKNNDYDNSFSTFGTIGIVIRMQDKINRLLSLTIKNQLVLSEGIADTRLDLMNYSAMAIMSMDNIEPYDKIDAMAEVHKEALHILKNDDVEYSNGSIEYIKRMQNDMLSCVVYTNEQISIPDMRKKQLKQVCYHIHIMMCG